MEVCHIQLVCQFKLIQGFKTDPFYTDFTLPTIDGFHNHILGGSFISLGNCYNFNGRYGFR